MPNEQPKRITADELDEMQKRFVKNNTKTGYGFGSGISDFDIPMDAALGERSVSRRIAQDRQRQQSKENQLREDGIRLIGEVQRSRKALAFYADNANWKSRIDEDGNTRLWDDSIAINDRGNVARGALEE